MLYFAFIPTLAQSMAHFTTRFNNNHHHPSTPVHVRHTRRHVTGTILMSPFPSAYANPRRAFCNAAPLPRIISISISRLAADVGIEIRPINKSKGSCNRTSTQSQCQAARSDFWTRAPSFYLLRDFCVSLLEFFDTFIAQRFTTRLKPLGMRQFILRAFSDAIKIPQNVLSISSNCHSLSNFYNSNQRGNGQLENFRRDRN